MPTRNIPLGQKTGTIIATGNGSITYPFNRMPRDPVVWFADTENPPGPCDPVQREDAITIEVTAAKRPPHTHNWILKVSWDVAPGKTRQIHWAVTVIDRFVGHVDKNIAWITYDKTDEGKPIEVQEDLEPVSDDQLFKDYIVRDNKVVSKYSAPVNVAIISVYGINCGIATYTKYLCDAMGPFVPNLKIFAERACAHQLTGPDPANVKRCWNRFDDDFGELIYELGKFNPDLIIIQHEFGIFPHLNVWGSLMGQLSKWRTLVTFHTVLDHNVDNETARLDYTTRALAEAPCREIIVHTPRARQPLRDRGFAGRIHYIPHGCFAPDRSPRLPSTKYGMFPRQTIFQYGFGGQHKGWEFAIQTVGLLKAKFPTILYIGVFNMAEHSAHCTYFQSLLDLIKDRRLLKNVSLQKGYQTEEMLKNFIKSSVASFFPYQRPNPHWASWGASGAIQLPMSLGSPMVLSDYPAFLEFEGKLPLVHTPNEAAEIFERIFNDPNYASLLSETSFAIADERRWDKVAKWYLETSPRQDYNAPI